MPLQIQVLDVWPELDYLDDIRFEKQKIFDLLDKI